MLENTRLQAELWCIAWEHVDIFLASLSGIPLLRVVGDFDHQATALFDEAARGALAPDCDCLLLDLSACPYVDSGGLGVVLTLYRDMRDRGWVGVIGPSPNVRRLLALAGLVGAESFFVFGDEDEAAALISAPRSDDFSGSSN